MFAEELHFAILSDYFMSMSYLWSSDVENFAMNVLALKASFKRDQSIYQKWTFTKKTMILLEAVVRRCY